jgi:hypothetical protein
MVALIFDSSSKSSIFTLAFAYLTVHVYWLATVSKRLANALFAFLPSLGFGIKFFLSDLCYFAGKGAGRLQNLVVFVLRFSDPPRQTARLPD